MMHIMMWLISYVNSQHGRSRLLHSFSIELYLWQPSVVYLFAKEMAILCNIWMVGRLFLVAACSFHFIFDVDVWIVTWISLTMALDTAIKRLLEFVLFFSYCDSEWCGFFVGRGFLRVNGVFVKYIVLLLETLPKIYWKVWF